MREIKFRGKRIDNGEWVYGDFVHCCPGDCYIGKIGAVAGRDVQFIGEICDPKTVGQYAELYDNNGKRIYEGDIVSIPDYKRVKVEFREGCFGAYDNVGFSPFRESIWGIGGEVVGNVWDHPHLMEVNHANPNQ